MSAEVDIKAPVNRLEKAQNMTNLQITWQSGDDAFNAVDCAFLKAMFEREFLGIVQLLGDNRFDS